MRWDYVTGFLGTLVEDVAEFSVNADGKKVAILRPRNITANGVELFDLALFDFESMQLSTIIEKQQRNHQMTISPDGNWVAYIPEQSKCQVTIVRTNGSKATIELGQCYQGESQSPHLAWSPDNQSVLWIDGHGIWAALLKDNSAQLVHPNSLSITDPEGKTMEVDVQFLSLNWSPLGRYALTKVAPLNSDVSWYAIIDTPTGRLIEVPDSFEQINQVATMSWALGGTLLHTHAMDHFNQGGPYVKFWRVLATHDDLLILDSTLHLEYAELPIQKPEISENNPLCVSWPEQKDAETIFMGLAIPGTEIAPVLFTLDLEDETLLKLFEIPSDTIEVLWSPDGGGTLIITSSNEFFFASMNGGGMYNLGHILSKDAHHFKWLPPAPRS